MRTMGSNGEEGKSDQPHAAFYGSRIGMLPYSNSSVVSSISTPHYIWAPLQSMVPNYGTPYAAFYGYAPYAHSGVQMVGVAPGVEAPTKSVREHKEIDGLAISLGNGSVDDNETATEHQVSDSEATDGSSHGSNGGLSGAAKGCRRRSHHGSTMKDVKDQNQVVLHSTEVVQASNKSVDATPLDANAQKSANMSTALDVNTAKPFPETLLQNEVELKRERRKQSNRESARRSRLRKQAEIGELATSVQELVSDNTNLKSEMNKIMEMCKKLKHENTALMDKFNDAQIRQNEDIRRLKQSIPLLATVNLLERVNKSDQENDDGEVYEGRSSLLKLHQLMDGGH